MIANAGLPLLLLAPFNPALFAENSCLTNNFYGNYQDSGKSISVFLSNDVGCFQTWESRASSVPSLSVAVREPSRIIEQLVWLEKTAVDASIQAALPADDFNALADRLSNDPSLYSNADSMQDAIGSPQQLHAYEILHRSLSAVLVSVSHDKAKVIDTLLPRFWKSTLLPKSPVAYRTVEVQALGHAESVLSKLKFDPIVASTVNNISSTQMKNDIRFLTGEDGKSGIISRHSFSPGARTAASWLKDRFEATGASCELKMFLVGFAPNVICRYSAVKNTTATVLLSAHYDSRGSFGRIRAPGGDDDGSGTVALLSIARAISRKGVRFHSNVELVAFAGEEQGLLGSRAYARELRAAKANLTLMIQADMLAYHAPEEPPQLGLPDLIGSPIVTQLVANVSGIYSPELTVGFTPACCSDHQSFHEQGFPATQVFERAGPIIDPMYHNSGDLSDRIGYDFEQIRSIAKVQFATLLHTAGFELSH